jgi:N-acetylglucosaminyldiphosphoundecaprenol N-acetyl-beta-D-mannosaminyltransferase
MSDVEMDYFEPTVLPPDRVEFLGVRFDAITVNELIRWSARRSPRAAFGYVVTPNVDHIVRLHRHLDLIGPIYRDSAYTVCDSRVLSTFARMAGRELPVMAGSDFTAAFLRNAARPDDPILIVGGEPDQIERLKSTFGLRQVAHHQPPRGLLKNPEAMDEAVRFIVSHPARYIFLAVGSPQQELIAHRVWQTNRAVGIGFCVGAAIDFLTGKAKRAPKVMQVSRLEWLHRLMREPRRLWRRYLVEDMRILGLYWRWRRDQRSK